MRELVLPLFFLFVATHAHLHTHWDMESPVCTAPLWANSAAGVWCWWNVGRKNRAGWMDSLIRLTPRDIWLEPAGKKNLQKTDYCFSPFSFFPFGYYPNQSCRSPSKTFLKERWRVSSSLISCRFHESAAEILSSKFCCCLVAGNCKHETEKVDSRVFLAIVLEFNPLGRLKARKICLSLTVKSERA